MPSIIKNTISYFSYKHDYYTDVLVIVLNFRHKHDYYVPNGRVHCHSTILYRK